MNRLYHHPTLLRSWRRRVSINMCSKYDYTLHLIRKSEFEFSRYGVNRHYKIMSATSHGIAHSKTFLTKGDLCVSTVISRLYPDLERRGARLRITLFNVIRPCFSANYFAGGQQNLFSRQNGEARFIPGVAFVR